MHRNSTLSLATLFVTSLFATTLTAQQTFVNNGNPATYNLQNGDSLYIASGTYTGKVIAFNTGAKITVASGATFQPEVFDNPKGSLLVYGIAKFTTLNTNDGFKYTNYGMLWTTGSVNFNGHNQTWINQFGATMRFDAGFTINNANILINKGTIISGSVTLNTNASLTNKYTITITGSMTTNTSTTLINEGLLQTSGSMVFNSMAGVYNVCRMVSGGGFTNNSNSVTNNGLMWAKANNNSTITNNGTITNTGHIKSVNLVNNSTLKGSGYFYFTGATTNYGTTGVSGITTDTLRIYDASRLNPSTIFDIQFGTVRPNTVYRNFTAPDTINNFSGCSVEMLANIPLPVKWNYFFVDLADNVPALHWSAEQDPGTIFEIQRSYDAVNYSTIKSVTADNNKITYDYNDAQVNTSAAIVYYRIRAIEPDGAQRLSDTRTVKFATKTGVTIQAAPNPFTSQFTIHYQGSTRSVIAIRVFGLNGQLQFSKMAQVSNGFNSITVTEAVSLPKGMYLVQISEDSKVVATEKIIKH